ncbi:VOC family protein [Paenibacillus sp. NEAU-GSW1]|uniref:VOC family protein n=1 Tax=Paenibacillus sp. NEAU-GSW1 TaxID=2682486 RepID=UPI0012E26FDA|nr:VOC family protein [Paenibacillus sp. NEAU-GSW1]MUT64636.1 hypothetical protein [Paenibacillus sp. NEAU-GSW1]
MSKPNLYGVGIFVPVSDLERSTKWYSEMLGFEITHRILKEKGANIGPIINYDGGIRGFALYDPDGNKYGVVH